MRLTIRGPAIRVRRRALTSIPGPLAHQLDDLFPVRRISQLVLRAYRHCSFSTGAIAAFHIFRASSSVSPPTIRPHEAHSMTVACVISSVSDSGWPSFPHLHVCWFTAYPRQSSSRMSRAVRQAVTAIWISSLRASTGSRAAVFCRTISQNSSTSSRITAYAS